MASRPAQNSPTGARIVTKPKIPHPPKDLRESGRRLWKDALADLEFEEHEMALLRAACRACDRLEAIAIELQDAPLTVGNRFDEAVTHPLIVEERMTAQALGRTLANLRLPQGIEDGQLQRAQRRGGSRGHYGTRGGSR